MADDQENQWKELLNELKEKAITPIGSPSFVIYFFMIILFAGFLGIGLTIFVENKLTQEVCGHEFSHIHINLALASYSLALLAASAADLILSKKNDDTQTPYVMIGIGSIILSLALTFFVLVFEHTTWVSYLLSIIGVFLAWGIWWITNSGHPHFKKVVPQNATPTGEEPLKGTPSKYKLN